MGFPIGANGNASQIAPPAPIQVPFGLKSTAVATGATTAQHTGPQGDQVFDMTFGGNLNQADYVSAVSSGGATVQMTTISTTVYDSLGDTHLINITFIPAAAINTVELHRDELAGGRARDHGAPTPGEALPTGRYNSQGAGRSHGCNRVVYVISPTDGSGLRGNGAGKPSSAGSCTSIRTGSSSTPSSNGAAPRWVRCTSQRNAPAVAIDR